MRRLIPVAAAALLITLAPGAVLGHSELVSADPAEDATVEGPTFPITLTFSEPLADGSKVEVLDSAAAVVLRLEPDPADLTRMAYTPTSSGPEFPAGDYTIEWTSVADDGDLLRGTIKFTVTSPPPTDTPEPSLEPSATPAPTPSPSPSPTPAPSTSPGDGTSSGSDVVVPIIAGLVLVGIAAWWLIRRRPSAP